jgi:drug/metabolite transporter (DMT)-like permease
VTWVFGIFFSLAIGTSDFFGAYLSRRAQTLTVVITFLFFGAGTVTAMLLVVDSEFLWRDLGFGALSGTTSGFALLLLYHGMSVSSAAVVSPMAALFTALIPVAWGVSTGDDLTGLAITGMVVALVGLLFSTLSPELGSRALSGAAWGLASGVFFGTGFALLGQASSESGMWAAVSQRSMALIVLVIIAASRGIPRVLSRSQLPIGLLAGVLAGLGIGAFVAGAQRGSLSEIAVTSSVFPAVTVVLASVFEAHPLRWWQLGGVSLVIGGVALIGLG